MKQSKGGEFNVSFSNSLICSSTTYIKCKLKEEKRKDDADAKQ